MLKKILNKSQGNIIEVFWEKILDYELLSLMKILSEDIRGRNLKVIIPLRNKVIF